MRDEKLYAAVARSTFGSQNVQNTPFPDLHAVVVRSTCQSRKCKTTEVRSTFGRSDVILCGRRKQGIVHLAKSGQDVRVLLQFQLQPPLHNTPLHYTTTATTTTTTTKTKTKTTLRYITLHYITLRYTCYITSLYTTLITLHSTPLRSTPLHKRRLQLQLELQLQLHYTTLHPAVVGEVTDQVTTETIAATSDSLCHSWFTTTKLSYKFSILKLTPQPCAVLLVEVLWGYVWRDISINQQYWEDISMGYHIVDTDTDKQQI